MTPTLTGALEMGTSAVAKTLGAILRGPLEETANSRGDPRSTSTLAHYLVSVSFLCKRR